MTHSGKRALVIAHEPDGPAGHVGRRLRQRGLAVDTFVVTPGADVPNHPVVWPDATTYDLVVPMGSVRSLTRKHEIGAWIHDELTLLRDLHRADTALLGICFGGQLLAEALGGTVEPSPNTEIGWFEIEAPGGQVNPAGPGPWKQWHHDRFTPPPGATVLAVNANAVQLFRIGRTVATQFHPEVDVAHVGEWLRACDDDYLLSHGVDRDTIAADMIEHEDRNIAQCHAFVDWFLDEVAFPARPTPEGHDGVEVTP